MSAWVSCEPWFTGSHILAESQILVHGKCVRELGSNNYDSPYFISPVFDSPFTKDRV